MRALILSIIALGLLVITATTILKQEPSIPELQLPSGD